MKEKKLFKNLIYIFFSLCFACTGFLFMQPLSNFTVAAEDSTASKVENEEVKPFFLREEITTSTSAEQDDQISNLSDDTFLYYNQLGTSNSLRFSFDLGNKNIILPQEIYNYVYYANKSDTTKFSYFDILTISVSYNGREIFKKTDTTEDETATKSFITPSNLSFSQAAGSEGIMPDRFEMNFVGKLEADTQSNEISILEEAENGSIALEGNKRANVKEGVYTIAMSYIRVDCNDGKLNLTESPNSFTQTTESFQYSFYCLALNSYFENNRPIIENHSFDHTVTLASSNNAYYLYSNYSSKGSMTRNDDSTYTFSGTNKIPYVEYDFSRYDVEISKSQNNDSSVCTIYYDVATQSIALGQDTSMVHTQIVGNKCRIYFTDVGNYTLTLNAIKLVSFNGQLRKYNLPAVSRNTRKVLVYMYGFQANFTNFDAAFDSNHNLPLKELKTQKYTDQSGNPIEGEFDESADVTSLFLSSNETYHQSGIEDTNDNNTFIPSNVINFLNTHSEIVPVKTNQPPIEFTSNAKLNTLGSYIFSTKKVSSNFERYNGGQLHGQDLYFSRFEGRTEGTAGTYIYILNYTFDNNYYDENNSAADTIYSQIFYFEISTELPSIEVFVGAESDGQQVQSKSFTNKDVTVWDTTKAETFNKDVTVQIYAWDFDNKQYRSDFGGVYGISLKTLSNGFDTYLLQTSAYYTLRLYYTNLLTDPRYTDITLQQDQELYFREMSFTIDKQKIDEYGEIKINNVEANVGKSDFKVVSTLDGISTNQKTAISWTEKNSGAKTEAYYRYFPINSLKYFPTTSLDAYAEQTAQDLSDLLTHMLLRNGTMPVEYALDLGNGSSWRPYKANTFGLSSISGDLVLSDEGLYILDIFDSAGNHSYELFLIDYTSPLFAIREGDGLYELASDPKYITNQARLDWGENKGIYVQNFNSNYFLTLNRDEVTAQLLSQNNETLYQLKDNTYSLELFDLIYDKLFDAGYLNSITNAPIINGTYIESDLARYDGMYFSVPINDVVYYVDLDHPMFTYEENTNHYKIISADREMNYRMLIRDKSNTKYDLSTEEARNDKTALTHYQNFYSATQTVIVSFDSSNFTINYTEDNTLKPFTSNFTEQQSDSKTTYLSPTNMDALFTLAFYPTISGDDSTIQVDTVTMDYYAYETLDIEAEHDGSTRYYYGYAKDKVTLEVFNYKNYNTPMRNLFTAQIQPNSNNRTSEGKYVITRTYKTGTGFGHNTNDFLKRTFMFYVDRNGVVSDPVYVGSGSNRHMESLVGGDIFVSMYDRSSIAVTFPNSDEGSTNNVTIFNNSTDTDEENIILPTNKVPVNVYVPAFKYTQYVERITNGDNSYFVVKTDSESNNHKIYNETTDAEGNVTKPKSVLPIQEYVLFAEIDKKIADGTWQRYATTQENQELMFNLINDPVFGNNTPVVNTTYIDSNGFLRFYRVGQTTAMPNITEAGDYRVTISQGTFTSEVGKPFKQSISFQFRIQDPTPNFEVSTADGNRKLNSTPKTDTTVETYYTNQAQLRISWDAPSSKYMAEIDIPNITIKTSDGREIVAGTVGNILGFWGDETQDTWPRRQQDGTYVASLDLRGVGTLGNLYRNGQELEITMRYKSPSNNSNQTVRKKIVVDLEAPSENVEALVDKTLAGFVKNDVSRTSLRKYSAAISGETPESLENTCFNESADEGNFAYFSYVVDKTYLTQLKDSEQNEYETYIREFVGKYSGSIREQETSHQSFQATRANFSSLNSVSELKANTYYEVVETDMAGNMAIYTIYVADTSLQQNLLSYTYIDPNNNEVEDGAYTVADYNEAKRCESIHNVYSPKGFTLTEINYFGDAWAQLRLSTLQGNITYMLSPLRKGFALNLSTGEFENVFNLIDEAQDPSTKISLSIFNRIYNQATAEEVTNDIFYINIRNTSLQYSLTDQQNREYITFDMPSESDIKDTQNANKYLTYLKITANGETIYEKENKVGFARLWADESQRNILVDTRTANKITFEINPELNLATNTRIEYIFRDNYGQENRDFHLYNERIISNPYTAENDYLYAYYDEDGRLFYITRDGFQYSFNAASGINVEAYNYHRTDKIRDNALTNATLTTRTSGGITTYTYKTIHSSTDYYDDSFVLVITYAGNDNIKPREVFFTLYNSLPTANETILSNNEGQFIIQDAKGTNITNQIINSNSNDESGYFSELRLLYRDYANPFLKVNYSLRKEDGAWQAVSSGQSFVCSSDVTETYYLKIWYEEKYNNEHGSARYIFGNVPQSQIFQFKLSPLKSAYWVEKTVGGVTTLVEKSDQPFISGNQQYTSHYIVNLSYADRNSIAIRVNMEQDLKVIEQPDELVSSEDPNVRSVLYLITNEGSDKNVTFFEARVVISYIPNDNDIVKKFYTYNLSGIIDTTDNLKGTTSKAVVIPKIYTTMDRIEIQWSHHYGIEQNEIKLELIKLDSTKQGNFVLKPTVYTKTVNGEMFNYTYITYSGKYALKFSDTAGNIHMFGAGTTQQTDSFNLIFLKDVPFTLTYTDTLAETPSEDAAATNQHTILPIKQAIYNSPVTLKIDPTTLSEFYDQSGTPTITVKRNGEQYTNENFTSTTNTFTFTETGFYEVTFSAKSSLHDIEDIREETYQFTILNPNENKISYVYNKYANYYIEKVVKDGQDITQQLLRVLDDDTITIAGKVYLAQLSLSYLDEKTGEGEYVITVNSNNTLLKNSNLDSSWTYKVNIKSGTAPIRVSLNEGESTTGNINITFNQENIFNELGQCTFRIIKQNDNGTFSVMSDSQIAIDANSSGEITRSITNDTGTFYMQFISPSDYLLFSYKVVRTAPMNAASIIAIVISAVVLVAIIFIVFKLRKRISVK